VSRARVLATQNVDHAPLDGPERAVKNWFQAKNGPSGELLVALCRHSELVLETVLRLAGRSELIRIKKLTDFRSRIQEMRALLDDLEASRRRVVPPRLTVRKVG
jgi:hypothetical protein